MNKKKYEGLNLSSDALNDALKIWADASISLIDIRHRAMCCNDVVKQYMMPANTFIFTNGSKATVILDDAVFNVERYGVFHGGKGTEISIYPTSDWFEYYMVLYKAGEPFFYKNEFIRLIGKSNPFNQQYGFSTDNPLFFLEKLKKMHEKWKSPTPLHLFFGKACFYELIYEIYDELENRDIQVLQSDFIDMAKRYLDRHYSENISIRGISSMLGVSDSHLRRSFKRQYSKSPQEYLTSIRLNAAKEMLLKENFPIHRVAEACGFSDEFNFSKLFSKHIGMSPSKFRLKTSKYMSDNNMDNLFFSLYNEKSLVSIGKHKEEGDFSMFKQIKGRSIIAMVLTMMLLLSACNSTPKEISIQDQEQAMTVQQEKDSKEETRIVHMEYGDVEIPVNPKRVVVAFVQGDLLALGITPVGTSFNDDAVFLEKMENVTVIDAFDVNEEEIMALDPDLIIWYDADAYSTLSKIAPTLAGDFHGMGYRDRLRFFGEIFNVSDKAKQLIKDFESKVEESKKLLKDANLTEKTVVLLENQQKGVLKAFGEGRGGDLIYNHLGLPAPERIQKEVLDRGDIGYINISYEMLNEYSGDYIFSNKNIAELQDNTVFNSLEAVQKGRLIETQTGMFWFYDIMSMNAQLDFIVNSLLESANSF